VIAAATEDDYDCENYDPGAVIVEEIAKAVVIHMFPPNAFWAKPIIILCKTRKKVSYFFSFRNIFYKKHNSEDNMFVYSVRASGIRYFLLIVLTLAVLIGSIIISESEAAAVFAGGEISLDGVGEHEGRVEFIKQFGYEIGEAPVSEAEFNIPTAFDRVSTDYNEIQRSQGLDLTKYGGKKVCRYTYEVKNYEGYEGRVLANVIVYRGRVIGCDISSEDPAGFVEPLIKLGK
jgi:hypothetical protein